MAHFAEYLAEIATFVPTGSPGNANYCAALTFHSAHASGRSGGVVKAYENPPVRKSENIFLIQIAHCCSNKSQVWYLPVDDALGCFAVEQAAKGAEWAHRFAKTLSHRAFFLRLDFTLPRLLK